MHRYTELLTTAQTADQRVERYGDGGVEMTGRSISSSRLLTEGIGHKRRC